MISDAQSGRMEEQRCSLAPSRSTPATPTRCGNNIPTGQKTTQGTKRSSMCFLAIKTKHK